jgi:hypothetical protein
MSRFFSSVSLYQLRLIVEVGREMKKTCDGKFEGRHKTFVLDILSPLQDLNRLRLLHNRDHVEKNVIEHFLLHVHKE